MNTPVLTTETLTIGYGEKSEKRYVVSHDIGLSLRSGEIVCLIGPNGAGKSTLIRTMAGLHPPLEGTIFIMGQKLSALKPKQLATYVGIVTTERVNVGMFSGRALVSLGRYPYTDWTGKLSEDDERIVEESIRAVGAESLMNRNVGELSDGERQKIMIARALAQDPKIIFLDEPTAFLDLPRRVEIMGLLKRLTRETDKAVLLSTHDLELAIQIADVLWLISSDGGIDVGAPEDLILSNAVEKNFTSEGVSFDKKHGAFIIHQPVKAYVGVHGKGLIKHWTEKALHREGFEVHNVPEECDFFIECRCNPNVWVLQYRESEHEYRSIYDLVTALRVAKQRAPDSIPSKERIENGTRQQTVRSD